MNPIKPTLIAIALASTVGAHAQSSNQPNTLTAGGRYVFGQVNEMSADQYMLDTISGRLWRLVDTVDGRGSVLEPVPYLLSDGQTTQDLPPDATAAPAPAERPILEPLQPLQPLLLEEER